MRVADDPSGDGKIVIFQDYQSYDQSKQYIAYLDQSQTPPELSTPIPVLDENKYTITGTAQSHLDPNNAEYYEEPVSYKAQNVGSGSDVVALGNDRVIVPAEAKTLKEVLKARGFTIYDPELSMITQGGGGVHCMCQALRREPG